MNEQLMIPAKWAKGMLWAQGAVLRRVEQVDGEWVVEFGEEPQRHPVCHATEADAMRAVESALGIVRQPAPPEWTDNYPKVSGWYWIHYQGRLSSRTVLQMVDVDGYGNVTVDGQDVHYLASCFYGPIVIPTPEIDPEHLDRTDTEEQR